MYVAKWLLLTAISNWSTCAAKVDAAKICRIMRRSFAGCADGFVAKECVTLGKHSLLPAAELRGIPYSVFVTYMI
jgi:hypothetical protein